MAGKKQHHIPQSLQRGFLFDVKAEKTYVHRRGGVTFPASISDVAAQRYFYSRLSGDGSKTLDDTITEYENRLGGLLIKLRAAPIDSAVDAEVAAETIAHLTPRSANMRRIFSNGIQRLTTAAAEAFSDEDTVAHMLGLAEPEPNQTWIGHITQMLDKEPQIKALLAMQPFPESLRDRMMFMATKEHFVGNFNAQSLGIAEAFSSLLHRLDQVVRDSHNKALEQGLISQARKVSLEELEWHIRAGPPEGTILPDCVALGVDEEGGPFLPYMMTKSENVSVVVMPITSEKLLVGTRPGHRTPDLMNFNREAAACSDELFITASQAPIFAEFGVKMGERWIGEIDAVVQGALEDVLPSKRLPSEHNCELPAQSLAPGYQLTFIGLGAEEEVAPLSAILQRLIEKVRSLFDLERFDGITFATNYPAALAELERGFDIASIPEGMPDHIARGAATVLVVRDGVPKVRIVMHAEYGQSLVANEQQDTEVALHLLIAGLAQACTLSQIEKALPHFVLTPVMMSDHDAVLHCAVRKAVRAYRYAHDSAGFGADEIIEQEFSNYLIDTFESTSATIAKAKEEHSASQDFPKLFEAAHGAASDMLISVARLVGHYHGMGAQEFLTAESAARNAMATRQLTSWCQIYSEDLQRFWQKGTWTLADFYALNIHAERVLWANGIALWREPNGRGTMIMAAPQQPPPP